MEKLSIDSGKDSIQFFLGSVIFVHTEMNWQSEGEATQPFMDFFKMISPDCVC